MTVTVDLPEREGEGIETIETAVADGLITINARVTEATAVGGDIDDAVSELVAASAEDGDLFDAIQAGVATVDDAADQRAVELATLAPDHWYASKAAGVTAEADGAYFAVPVSTGVEIYRVDVGGADATLISTVPLATDLAAMATSQASLNVWPDPWFTYAQSATDTAAEHRLYSLRTAFANRTWEAAYNHAYGVGAWKFDSGSANLMGFDAWWDMAPEVGLTTGDAVSVGVLVVGSGGSVRMWNRFFDSIASNGDYTYNGAEVSGGSAVTMDGTPKLIKIENRSVPSGSTGIVSYLDDVSASDFRVLGFWVVKGATAGNLPPARENQISIDEKILAAVEDTHGTTLDKADWAVGYGAVYDTADVTTVLAASSQSVGSNSDATINGWGDILAPAGVTFNAIRIGGELRQPSGATPCDRLFVVVRKAATGGADNAAATIVADGYLDVNPDNFPLTDQIIALREPSSDGMSGALLTLSDTELDLDEYGVMVYGRTSAGANAGISEPRGTLTNRVGTPRSYYVTSANPRTGAWSVNGGGGGNPAQSLEHVFIDPIEDGFKPSEELRTALGDAVALETRVGNALTTYGVPASHVWGEWRLREARARLRRLKRAQSTSLDIGWIGDSWSTEPSYWMSSTAAELMTTYGDGGPGWVGFGANGSTLNGNARPARYALSRTGTWAGSYRNSPTPTNSPDIANATSSEAGAKYTLVASGATAVITVMTLFWNGTADGVVRYRWDAGSWTSLNVQGSGNQSANLGSLPASANWTLEIEVVSGSVDLFGLNGKAASGLRFHKLGSSGSRGEHWLLSDAAGWEASIAALGLHTSFVMLGTNESVGDKTPGEFGTNLAAIVSRLATALPYADKGVIMPCENGETNTYTMQQYAAEAIAVAHENDCAWMDLQYLFGLEYADYGAGVGRDWMVNTTHPRTDGAAPIIDDAVIRLLTS